MKKKTKKALLVFSSSSGKNDADNMRALLKNQYGFTNYDIVDLDFSIKRKSKKTKERIYESLG